MKVKFSVITITFNNYADLLQTWLSLKMQCFDNWEWVVIDGGSSDQTKKWLQDLIDEQKENIIRFISEPDDGIYDAMNKGIDNSNGEYVIFMNSGDCFAFFDVLLKVNNTMREFPVDFIYCDSYELDVNETRKLKKSRHHRWLWYGMFAHHQAMIFRTTILAEQRYRLEYPIGADYAFVAEFLQRSTNIIKLAEPFCVFRRGELSNSREGIVQAYKDQKNIRKNILNMRWISIVIIGIIHKVFNALHIRFPAIYHIIRGMRNTVD